MLSKKNRQYNECHILAITRKEARSLNLCGEDSNDYCAHFILGYLKAPLQISNTKCVLYGRSAGMDYLRALRKQQRREICNSQCVTANEEESTFCFETPDYTNLSPETGVLRSEFWQRICRVAEQLNPQQQQIFWMYVVEDRSAEEVARVMGRSVGAIRQSASLLLKRLRNLLEKQGIDVSTAKEYVYPTNRR